LSFSGVIVSPRGNGCPFFVGFQGQGAPMPDGSAEHDGRDTTGGCVLNGSPMGRLYSTNHNQ
jgi:hypothetical protein